MASHTIYDHPLYYDILFGWDRTLEAGFYDGIFDRLGVPKTQAVLEVACGTGQVARLLADRGRKVAGFDVNPDMVAFLLERAAAEGVRVDATLGDMTTFATDRPFAGAFNPMSSFRLLGSDAEADAHLRAMAAALRPGGVYVLDLDFLGDEDETPVTTDESWVMTRGNVTVRADDDAIHVDDDGAEIELAWGQEVHLRGYTSEAFLERVAASGVFRAESWHPETKGADVSVFQPDRTVEPPVAGRAMVVLRRE